MAEQRLKAPPLGARVKASGYMVRRKPDIDWSDTHVTKICWKRHPFPVWGVFFGVRHLSIGWLFPESTSEGSYYKCRKVASITVYAIAINRRAVRYVLPRDVEAVGDG